MCACDDVTLMSVLESLLSFSGKGEKLPQCVGFLGKPVLWEVALTSNVQ